MTTKPILSPSNDFVFKALFGDERNLHILTAFLKAALDLPPEEYERIEIVNPFLPKEYRDDKFGILDVRLHTTSGRVIDLEMQVFNMKGLKERFVYYASKLVTSQPHAGDEYGVIHPVVSINILMFDLFDDDRCFHHQFSLYDENTRVRLTDALFIHTIEATKIDSEATDQRNETLRDWIRFIRATEEAEMAELAKKNQDIAKATVVVKKLSADERMYELALAREKQERDHASILALAREQRSTLWREQEMALMAEPGLIQRIAQGLEPELTQRIAKEMTQRIMQDLRKGMAPRLAESLDPSLEQEVEHQILQSLESRIAQLAQGIEQAHTESARRMKADGMEIALIAKYTELSTDEIEAL